MKPMRWWLAFAWVACVAVVQADFVPPAEGPVPFRRDKLPVDVDTMGALSRQVTTFTGAPLPEGAPGSRALAQMTGLALALDPANRQARDLISALATGDAPEKADEKDLDRARSRVWQVLGWLEMPEAGPDAQALAACLGDVLALVDPDHPKAKGRHESGELGAWKDWIAPESAFKKKEAVPVVPEPMGDKGKAGPAIALAELSIPAPVWNADKAAEKDLLEMVRVNLAATAGSESGKLEFKAASPEAVAALQKAAPQIEAAITRHHSPLDGGLLATLSWEKEKAYSPTPNGAALTGTAALLLDGALTGKPPTATALAVVGAGGKLELPPRFWQSLRAMSAQPSGGRLILPAAAADYLNALLVVDDAAFFMKYEVLLAANADELLDLGSGTAKPAITDGLTRFAEITKAGVGKPLGTFVAHPSTQSRLNQLAASMPQHASARLLALQGSGNRPRFLQRSILAREIRDALQPISYLAEPTTSKLLPKRLDEIHEQSREKLDAMFGIIEIRDRDLHKSAVAVADSVRTVARLLDKEDNVYRYDLPAKQIAAHQAAWRDYLAALRQLTEVAGDGAEFTIPKPVPGS